MWTKQSKYKAIKTKVDGITFDSKKEAQRYRELKLLERAGVIKDLQLQVPFELVPKHEIEGIKIRATKYIADFVYKENDILIVEDCKGFRTKEYLKKKKQLFERYGLIVKET